MKTTITEKITLLTKKGMRELKKNIIQLEHDRQKTLKQLHDIEKTSGKEESLSRIDKVFYLESIEEELAEKKAILLNAQLLPAKQTRLQVAIGSFVELIDRHGRIFRYKIVDSVEANPSDGRISTLSPLGQSLLGKTIKDTVELKNGPNVNQFQLVKIF